MASVSHEPAAFRPERPQWAEFLKIRELWASLAISMMWLAVLVDAVWGPNFVSTSSGGNSTTIPSAIFVGLFAFLASASVAKYAFRQDSK
jgi:F0F1-type ATP synthase assembly protein I